MPAPLDYCPPGHRPYPKSICTSVNHQVCHGIPGDKVLKHGDIVNIDITVIKDGYHGDTSRMFLVGEPSIQARRLCEITYECMWKGIAQVRPGARLGDIGHAIQRHAEANGYSVVREFCGHGIGRRFHEEPQVLHYGQPGQGAALRGRHDLHRRAHDQRRPARHPRARPTAGPSSPRTTRCRRSGSTRSLVTPAGFEILTRVRGHARDAGLRAGRSAPPPSRPDRRTAPPAQRHDRRPPSPPPPRRRRARATPPTPAAGSRRAARSCARATCAAPTRSAASPRTPRWSTPSSRASGRSASATPTSPSWRSAATAAARSSRTPTSTSSSCCPTAAPPTATSSASWACSGTAASSRATACAPSRSASRRRPRT